MPLHSEYRGLKIIITENGAAFQDVVNKSGTVEDDDRIGYLNFFSLT